MPFSRAVFTRYLLMSCALVCVPAAVHAQEEIQLEGITVEGEQKAEAGKGGGTATTGPVEGYVATQTVTGSKTSAPLIEIPQSISIVTKDQIEDRGSQNLGEALNYTAGLVTQPFGNDPRYFNPIIRGFDSVSSVYLNNFRFIRDFGALAFEPYGLERIEVLRGPASVLYGQGEPGGIVNLIQKRPTGTSFGETGIEVGSDNRFVAKLDAGGAVNDVLSYRLTTLGRLADHQMDYVEDNRFYIAPTVTIAPDADTSLTLLSSLQRDTGTSPIGLPQSGTLDPNPNGEIPRSRYLGEPDFNDNESTLATLGYEFRHRFNETFEFRQNAQYLSFDADYNNLFYFTSTDDRTAVRGPGVNSETIDSFAIDNQLEADFDTGIFAHKTLFGLDYRHHNQWRSANFGGTYSPIDVFDPVYGTPIVVDPTTATITDVTLQQTGLYVQDQIKIDRLALTLGLRQDWATNENELTGDDVDDDALTGRAGAVYLFDNGLAPYVSYSTSFNPTAGTTTAGDLYEPTEGEQIEAGVKFQPEGWNSFITASVYDLTKSNVPATQYVPGTGGGLVEDRTQVGEIESRGFELEATASLTQGLSLVASYAYTDAEITQGDETVVGGVVTATTTGNRPANVPEHTASLWLNYEIQPGAFLEGVSFGAGVRYVGERFGNNANTISLPSNTLFDAALRYEQDAFAVSLNVNNIADERYIASCNFGCFFGEGRTVLGSVMYKW